MAKTTKKDPEERREARRGLIVAVDSSTVASLGPVGAADAMSALTQEFGGGSPHDSRGG
jgi:hypothetical protein